MTFETSKNLSGVGALLIVIGFFGSLVPYAGLLSLIGVILLLIGLKGLSNFYKEDGIFNNAIYAIIIAVVGVVVAVAALIMTALSALAAIGININNISDWAAIGGELGGAFTNFADFGAIMSLIGAVVLALVLLFVFAIISMFFFKKSMNKLSSKSGVGLFGTAGLLMLIGALLTIVIIGVLLIWIGFLLAAVAFFQMKQPNPPPPP